MNHSITPGNALLRRAVMGAGLWTFAAIGATQASCAATPQPLRAAANVPASEGTVTATEGDNGNTNIALRVKHLAHPERVTADATVYVVWLEARGGARQSLGALAVNDNLEGSLDAVTAYRKFRVTITPEASAQVTAPNHEPVFSAAVERE